jgi:hypothetical protein
MVPYFSGISKTAVIQDREPGGRQYKTILRFFVLLHKFPIIFILFATFPTKAGLQADRHLFRRTKPLYLGEVFMKRIACVVVLAACLAAGLSAQSKIAVGLDAMPLLKGIIYADNDADNSLIALSPSVEFRVVPHASVGATVDLWFGESAKIDIFYLGLTAQGRWYPLSTGLDKFFLGAGIGFNMFAVDGEINRFGGFTGITTGLKAGYKVLFGKFFVEPSMAYVYSKTTSVGAPLPLGWQAGLTLGAAF